MHFYSQDGTLLLWENPASVAKSQQYNIYLGAKRIAKRYSTGPVYVHTDHLGSLLAETSVMPVTLVSSSPHWEPYGAPAGGAFWGGLQFAGHYQDPTTRLTYMQQRYYDPYAGRFLAVDPVAASPGSFNRYWYTDNNPYRYVDPDGREKKAVWLVELVQGGLRKVARVSQERAVQLRREGGAEANIATNRRQLSHQIETAANPGKARRDVAHELKDGSGSKGLPHYQSDGVKGHTFWGKLSVAAAAAADSLDQVAEAAAYIPESGVRPGEQQDAERWNNMMGIASEVTGVPMPGIKTDSSGGFKGYFRVDGRVDSNRLNEEMKK